MNHLDIMVKLCTCLPFPNKSDNQSEKYLVQPPSAKNPVLLLTVSHILRCYSQISIMLAHSPKNSTFHRQATGFFFVVCRLIWFISLLPILKGREQKEKLEKPQILNVYIAGTRLCVYFLKLFYL